MPRVKPKRLLHYSRTCAYYLQYHIIFCTKNRRKVLTEPVMKDLIDADVNLNIPSLMKKLKGPSARELFRTHPEIKKYLYGDEI